MLRDYFTRGADRLKEPEEQEVCFEILSPRKARSYSNKVSHRLSKDSYDSHGNSTEWSPRGLTPSQRSIVN